MKKIKGKWVCKQIVKRLFSRRFFQKLRNKNHLPTSADDAQLQLYSKILPGDFLHYGFFDDPSQSPESMSLDDIYRAQERYAELLMEQITDPDAPVLDAGCGMGGLLKLLIEKGYSPTGLTPDRYQIDYLNDKYTGTNLIHCIFEDMPPEGYSHYFGTVIHSESLQYMVLEEAISVVQKILKPGGRWIVVDYFRTHDSRERSGFKWDVFKEKLLASGMKITAERDITHNVCPTLSYIYMWGKQIGVPTLEFAIHKLGKKQPAIAYLLENVISAGEKSMIEQLEISNPEVFAATKKYMLLTIERNT